VYTFFFGLNSFCAPASPEDGPTAIWFDPVKPFESVLPPPLYLFFLAVFSAVVRFRFLNSELTGEHCQRGVQRWWRKDIRGRKRSQLSVASLGSFISSRRIMSSWRMEWMISMCSKEDLSISAANSILPTTTWPACEIQLLQGDNKPRDATDNSP
jgi:hypothetical protein